MIPWPVLYFHDIEAGVCTIVDRGYPVFIELYTNWASFSAYLGIPITLILISNVFFVTSLCKRKHKKNQTSANGGVDQEKTEAEKRKSDAERS